MITVFGSINMDLVATAERMPRPGETVPGRTFETTAGGKGANQALAARKAGSVVRMVGAVGDDVFSAPALAHLSGASVDLSGIATRPVATGTAIILVDAAGENMITVVPGANAEVTAATAETSTATMAAGDILMLQMEIPPEAIERALLLCREKGVVSMLNIAPFTPDTARLAALADVIVANESEFALLTGSDMANAAGRMAALKELHERSGQTIVVTLGPDGVIAMRDGDIVSAESLAIKPVDTVGAGDTFCGYLAAGLDQQAGFAHALKRAAIAGSLACLAKGAQTAIPSADAVDQRL